MAVRRALGDEDLDPGGGAVEEGGLVAELAREVAADGELLVVGGDLGGAAGGDAVAGDAAPLADAEALQALEEARVLVAGPADCGASAECEGPGMGTPPGAVWSGRRGASLSFSGPGVRVVVARAALQGVDFVPKASECIDGRIFVSGRGRHGLEIETLCCLVLPMAVHLHPGIAQRHADLIFQIVVRRIIQ